MEAAKKIDDDEKKKRLSQISVNCSICKLDFGTPNDFIEHKRESHPSPPPDISQSSVPFVPPTWQEDDAEYKEYHEKGWQSWTRCRFCNDSFPGSKALERHISYDHNHPSLLAINSAALETGHKDENEIGDVDVDVDYGEENEIWLTNEAATFALRMLAESALEYYNNQNPGKRYALVRHGPNVSTGTMDHINFKAKEEDCPDAPDFLCTSETGPVFESRLLRKFGA